MSAQPYLIVPKEKYQALEEKATQKIKDQMPLSKESPIDTPTTSQVTKELTTEPAKKADSPAPDQQGSMVDGPSTSISPTTRELVKTKKIAHRAFEKFVKAVDTYSQDGQFSNLDELIKSALNRSSKAIENEEDFYAFLETHGLMYLVRNPHKIRAFFPLWYRSVE